MLYLWQGNVRLHTTEVGLCSGVLDVKKKCFFELHHHRSILLGWLVGWQLREKEFLENLLETSYD